MQWWGLCMTAWCLLLPAIEQQQLQLSMARSCWVMLLLLTLSPVRLQTDQMLLSVCSAE